MNPIERCCAEGISTRPRSPSRAIAFCCSLLLLVALSLSIAPTAAQARIQQQTEKPGQVVYQARHTLKDNAGDAWQVIFYKRIQQETGTANTNLRLAGFPGAVEFLHPANLVITTARGDILNAPDRFADESPAPNIGEYQLNAVVNRLPSRGALEIMLPLKERSRVLPIPFPVILEWQNIIDESDVLARKTEFLAPAVSNG